jgi:hypothetical protein
MRPQPSGVVALEPVGDFRVAPAGGRTTRVRFHLPPDAARTKVRYRVDYQRVQAPNGERGHAFVDASTTFAEGVLDPPP